LDPDELRRHRRYFIVFTAVATSLVTPPTIVAQLALAVPTLLLYEAVILVAAGCRGRP
jgi:sec-independent protein translocase protein TatC